MLFSQLKTELDHNIKRRVYVFTGPERGVIDVYLRKLGVQGIYQSFDEALPLLRGSSLFEDSHIIAVREGFESYDYNDILAMCKNKHRIIFVPVSVDTRKKFYTDGTQCVVEFEHFTPEQLAGYVNNLMPALSLPLCALIAKRSGSDVLRINNACHKLTTSGEPITKELIEDLLVEDTEERIFELAEKIILKQNKEAISILNDLYELKVNEIQVLVILYNSFKLNLFIQHYYDKTDGEIASMSGTSVWAVRRNKHLRGSRPTQYYLDALILLFTCESDIKSGRIIASSGLKNIICRLLKNNY